MLCWERLLLIVCAYDDAFVALGIDDVAGDVAGVDGATRAGPSCSRLGKLPLSRRVLLAAFDSTESLLYPDEYGDGKSSGSLKWAKERLAAESSESEGEGGRSMRRMLSSS